jgi:hypothetical protein
MEPAPSAVGPAMCAALGESGAPRSLRTHMIRRPLVTTRPTPPA